jgi:NAD(P)-dependent dehydrogenase (short-subunit alcohol dehydrogenase family)
MNDTQAPRKTALVTGATSGIGREVALRLAASPGGRRCGCWHR